MRDNAGLTPKQVQAEQEAVDWLLNRYDEVNRMSGRSTDNRCECADPGCPVHAGNSECTRKASIILFRIDMEDETGTGFCEECADDAMEAGVFTDSR